jgi:DNA-binding Lrp family transcriptional regulator
METQAVGEAPTRAAPDADRKRSKLTRGLSVLNAFRAGDAALTLSDLARRTALPKPTVHRLVKELVEAGFLEREGQALRLGHSLARLGARVPQHHLLRRVALPRLRALRQEIGASVFLLLWDGERAARLASAHAPALGLAAREERHLVCERAVGRVFPASAARIPGPRAGSGTPAGGMPGLPHAEGAGLVSVCLPLGLGPYAPVALLVLVGRAEQLPPVAVRRAAETARSIRQELRGPGREAG